MGVHLDRVDTRARLEPRRDPYWHKLTQGRYVGFRKMERGAVGTWLARAFVGDRADRVNPYESHPLGDFALLAEKDRFDAAKKAAEEWFAHLDLGGAAKPGTVKQACEDYAKTHPDAEAYYERHVYEDPIAKVNLAKATKQHFAAWAVRVERKSKTDATYNRNLTPFRAALNAAWDAGKVTTNEPWRKALKPKATKGKPRDIYLDLEERRTLIDKASEEVRPLLAGLALIPMRPGELAGAKVGDFDARQRELRVSGKTGARTIPLSPAALEHFKACAKGKLPGAWLVARADGSQWKKEAWRDAVKEAQVAARLPPATVAYSIRHSVIADLVKGGLDLYHVSKLAGTSVKMIQETYGKFQKDHAREALAALAL